MMKIVLNNVCLNGNLNKGYNQIKTSFDSKVNTLMHSPRRTL